MKKLLICNHKMFLTNDEANQLKKTMDEIDFSNQELIVCPSYLNLGIFNNYELGSQNCFYEDRGPFTGEISSYQLSLIGVKYVILGHYERRNYETDEIINLKVKSALRNSITPILCVGETLFERELRKSSDIIKRQLKKSLHGVLLEREQQIIIAYEPEWTIGANKTMELSEIEDALKYISKILDELDIHNYKLVYGGSISSKNIKDILSDKIDGYLLGSSSVDEFELKNIAKYIK